MAIRRPGLFLLCAVLGGWAARLAAAESLPPAAAGPSDFVRDIQPILAEHCYKCHGPTQARNGLRLNSRADALEGGDGGPALVPRDSAASRMIQLVAGLDPDLVMPAKGERLTAEQIGRLRAWIDQGAVWPVDADTGGAKSNHWAFIAPQRPALPAVRNATWPRNAIDRFVLARLEKERLAPSPEADRYTLIRRLYIDLLGLLPEPAAVDAFVNDVRPDAYERLVEKLLASPHYGERWGRRWLDVARYADTNGYEKDRARSIWPYRDWVIGALNDDMPFDQFTIEQIAGDMLPHATQSQRIATGFHRNSMINEEGGIDVEQFRYEATVDRVNTTGEAWLGLTIGCARCHSHKYDPITQKEYWRLFAFLNNADEPQMEVRTPELTAQRAAVQAKIAKAESALAGRFPAYEETFAWDVLRPARFAAAHGTALIAQGDGSLLADGDCPEADTYTITCQTRLADIVALRLEALTDPSLPKTGPGRAEDGNFVVSELVVKAGPTTAGGAAETLAFAKAEADFSQDGFAVADAIDGDPKSGWAIDNVSGKLNQKRTATFHLTEPVSHETGTTFEWTVQQNFGHRHNLGHFRLLAGRRVRSDYHPELPLDVQRRRHLDAKRTAWEARVRAKSSHWTILDPGHMSARNHATLTRLDDRSVLVSGDFPNRDTYEVALHTDLQKITALRLEVLPHPSLPDGGPGRAVLFSRGDFLLSEIRVTAAPADGSAPAEAIALQNGTHDYASKNRSAALAIDNTLDTGWAIGGGQGKPHAAVFEFKRSAGFDGGTRLVVTLVQHYIHQQTIGRFRISVTTDEPPVQASGLPAAIEAIVLTPADERSEAARARLERYFLLHTPEMADAQQRITKLRKSMPRYPTTMVLNERPTPRVTHRHHRGEFLQPKETVTPGVPAVLHALPEHAPRNRLSLARWLVDARNPLVGRVIMNRLWQAYFGRGLVVTSEDFGTQGARPTHPALLDWLATEFVRQGWKMKAMHRLIVGSATYRQSSRVTPALLKRDPKNALLARGPRFRIEAEVIRDLALAAGGVLSDEIGGPSVFPPQPAAVTALSYGAMKWTQSQGRDRYRRGMYTFWKRTSPYPAFTVFDAPSADTTCVRRVRSNTPLQALTLLNDTVFVEAAQALARRIMTETPADPLARARHAFRICLTREPDDAELEKLTKFYDKQLRRFRDGKANAIGVALQDSSEVPADVDVDALAAWTTVARALLNVDEMITKD